MHINHFKYPKKEIDSKKYMKDEKGDIIMLSDYKKETSFYIKIRPGYMNTRTKFFNINK